MPFPGLRSLPGPTRSCVTAPCATTGILGQSFFDAGRGQLQHCEITANGGNGLSLRTGGAPEVTGCTISRNTYEAIWITYAASTGVFRDNTLAATYSAHGISPKGL